MYQIEHHGKKLASWSAYYNCYGDRLGCEKKYNSVRWSVNKINLVPGKYIWECLRVPTIARISQSMAE